MRLDLQFSPQILGGLRENAYICNAIINLKLVCLCGSLVNVVASNYPKTGGGMYVILVVIAFVPHA